MNNTLIAGENCGRHQTLLTDGSRIRCVEIKKEKEHKEIHFHPCPEQKGCPQNRRVNLS